MTTIPALVRHGRIRIQSEGQYVNVTDAETGAMLMAREVTFRCVAREVPEAQVSVFMPSVDMLTEAEMQIETMRVAALKALLKEARGYIHTNSLMSDERRHLLELIDGALAHEEH